MRTPWLGLLLCVATAAVADEIPPEVKKTVDAWVGHWKLEAPMPPGKASMSYDCKKVALGRGVVCIGHGQFPGLGNAEETVIYAYDVEGKFVHAMDVNSAGEVRDEHCKWQDDKTLACEDVSYTWSDAHTLTFTTVTSGPNGAKQKVTGTGKRR